MYYIDNEVVGSDGNHYIAVVDSININPVGDTTDTWSLYSAVVTVDSSYGITVVSARTNTFEIENDSGAAIVIGDVLSPNADFTGVTNDNTVTDHNFKPIGIAVAAAADGATASYTESALVNLVEPSGETWSNDDVIYYDVSENEFTSTSTDNLPVGRVHDDSITNPAVLLDFRGVLV